MPTHARHYLGASLAGKRSIGSNSLNYTTTPLWLRAGLGLPEPTATHHVGQVLLHDVVHGDAQRGEPSATLHGPAYYGCEEHSARGWMSWVRFGHECTSARSDPIAHLTGRVSYFATIP